MTVRKGQTIELSIEKMAFGGAGVARADGLVVFVRGAVAGDRVLASVSRKKKDYAEARVAELLAPSVDRVAPPCPYSGYCGGCQWQHVRYERQLAYKTAIVRESLHHLGGMPDVPVRDALPSEEAFGYRNKMEFSFSDRRWRLPGEMSADAPEEGFVLGLHVPGTYHKVLDVEACLLQQDTGNAILREVKEYARSSGLPPYGLRSHQGFWRFLVLRHSKALDRWMVNIVTSESRREVVQPLANRLCARFEGIVTVVNNVNTRRAAIAVGEFEEVLAGDGTMVDNIGPYAFRISANAFFQTNSLGALRLYEQVMRFADPRDGESVLDLYSGTGTIPIFMAGRVGSITGFEVNPGAVSDALANCRRNGIANCRFIEGDILVTLPRVTEPADLMVIDPPRAGMHKEVVRQVLMASPSRIIYVSCNPATLARDLALLSEGYEVIEVQPVDMFPHTFHIEAVANLRKKTVDKRIGIPYRS
jgi:23S rRNA (uracil1939-C5)-methyltransferase